MLNFHPWTLELPLPLSVLQLQCESPLTAGDRHVDGQNKESLMSLYKPRAVEPDLWWLVWTIFPTVCHLLKWANSTAVADGKLPRIVTFSWRQSTAEQWRCLCVVILSRIYLITYFSHFHVTSSAVFLPSVALQLPEGLQMFACVIGDIIERYSEWKSDFSSQRTSELGSVQQVQKESQHDTVLKGCSHFAIIRRTRASPNSLPLAQAENPQQREMITVFWEGAVIPFSLLFARGERYHSC